MASPAFRITINDAAVVKLFAAAPSVLQQATRRLIEAAAIDIQREMRIAANVGATGDLRRSIRYTFSPATLTAVIEPTVDYAPDVEYGSRPHYVSASPGTPLARWARMKGLNPFAVQASILKKGTRAHPFVSPTYEKMAPQVKEDIANGIALAVQGLTNV